MTSLDSKKYPCYGLRCKRWQGQRHIRRGQLLSTRGIQRERQVRALLEAEGWWVCRAAGSLGDADLVALRGGCNARLVEVKSTARGPYHSFGPKDRSELLQAANKAGALAILCWWPPRKKPQWIPSHSWPKTNFPGEDE